MSSKNTTETTPHPTFVRRHVCRTCGNTKDEAEAFAASAHASRRNPTGKNTVFIANNMVYLTHEPSHEPRLGIRQKTVFKHAAPKYLCWPTRGPVKKKWSCEFQGNTRAKHDVLNGHYYYCEDST